MVGYHIIVVRMDSIYQKNLIKNDFNHENLITLCNIEVDRD